MHAFFFIKFLGSFEQSPRLLEGFQDHFGESNNCFDILGDSQLKEDLADAMKECPGIAHRDSGKFIVV